MSKHKSPGQLYIISAPSGAGKSSLITALLQRIDNLVMSISYTTRAARALEKHGVDYFFIDETEFNALQNKQLFLEHAKVFGHQYGTSKVWVEETIKSGKDIILELDWQGHRSMKAIYPQAIGVFILPPSRETLLQRLTGRGQDSEAVIAHRMQQASQEISHYHEYEYLIVNHDFATAVQELSAVVQAARLRLTMQELEQSELINSLLPN
ncbi:MAG TPA: guanylate kinase [Gammaproteobacteria bacterium]|nr:guanylate kinase [Gammaproteobacteria bacterium]